MTEFPFIGRQDARNTFHSMLSIRPQKNVLYIEAKGGLGKTRLLRELMAAAQKRPHWHVCPENSTLDPLIDLYDLSNRSVMGLRSSIVARIGRRCFPKYRAQVSVLRGMHENAEKGGDRIAQRLSPDIVALNRRIDTLFFQEMEAGLRGRQVVLFLDTFEVVARRRVGRWFLEEFLPRSRGCIVVFAGRPVEPKLEPPDRVLKFLLEPWNEQELEEYFEKREWPEGKPEDLPAVYRMTKGHPLLVDMLLHTRDPRKESISEFLESIPVRKPETVQQMEWALVNRLVAFTADERQALADMAYLKQRFDPRVFDLRQQGDYPAYKRKIEETGENRKIEDIDELHTLLEQGARSPIIKYRSEGKVLALHDEVQRMIELYADRRTWDDPSKRVNWEENCDELYEQIVQQGYPGFIADASSDQERELLKAEQLAYELDRNADRGLKLYQSLFEDVQRSSLFTLNELVWGEVRERLDKLGTRSKDADDPSLDGQSLQYKLCYKQAEWLWSKNQFDACADIYRLIADRYAENLDQKLDALAALGHALMQTRKYKEAGKVFEEGRKLAKQARDLGWMASFEQNVGQLQQNMCQWQEALHSFQRAAEIADQTTRKLVQSLPYMHLGSLQAQFGNYGAAIVNCLRSVSLASELLLEASEDDPIGWFHAREGRLARVALASIRLGDAYRYARPQQREEARRSYERALRYLPESSEFRYHSEALQGLGNVFFNDGDGAYKRGDLASAVHYQQKAFDYLNEAITLNRAHNLELLLPKSLHRVAHVVFAVGQLEQAAQAQYIHGLNQLSQDIKDFKLPEEAHWMQWANLTNTNIPFDRLDTFAKAQRLFEVSSLSADDTEDVSICMDSLVQAGEVALYRKEYEDVQEITRQAQVRSQDAQQDLYDAQIELLLADLDLSQNRADPALQRYSENVPQLARGGGFGFYMLIDRLSRLGPKVSALGPKEGIAWCDELIRSWSDQGMESEHPELIARLMEIRNQILDTLIK